MKKMFISVMALAISVMAMATESAYVRVRLTSATSSSSVVRLTEDDARTADYESGYDSDKMMSQANSTSVLLYGIVGTHKCEDVMTNALQGLELGFYTNQVDVNYTLSFENVSGTVLTLYDRVAHKAVLMENSGSYPFSVEAAQVGRVAINDRFVIGVPAAYNVTLNAYGFASFSASESVVVPDGVDAYQAKFVSMNEEVTLTKIAEKIIPANTGVILYGVASANHSLAVLTNGTATLPTIALNDLKPTSAFDPNNYSNVFVLKGDALLEYVGTGALADNKAYLQIPGNVPAPKRIRMVMNQETGVENVGQEPMANCQKLMIDGQVFIRRGDAVYNLQGQMVK